MWLQWYWAVALTVLCLGVATATRRRHVGVSAAFTEAAVLSLLYTAWRIVGRISVIHPEGAFTRAQQLWDFERMLRIPNEAAWQDMILDSSAVVQAANVYYGGAHVPFMGVFLVWMFFWHRDRYPPWRNALAVSTIACVLVQLIPVAPPRLVPEFGLIDTPHLYGQSVYPSAGASLSGQLQAMPSIHVGWAALIAFAVWSSERGWPRWTGAVHLALTSWVVVVTGNHYWLDGVVAIIILVAVLWGLRTIERRRATVGGRYGSEPMQAQPKLSTVTRPSRVTRAVAVLALTIVSLVGTVAVAGAHSELLGASPAAGQRYAPPLERLELQFDETVTFPDIELVSPDGRQLSGLLSSPREGNIRITLAQPETAIGTWTARWEVKSPDGDATTGEFTFGLAEGAPAMQDLPATLVSTGGANRAEETARSPLFFAALGITIALGAVAVWLGFDALSKRIRSNNE